MGYVIHNLGRLQRQVLAGTTLVEVMLSVVILGVLAVAGGAVIAQTRQNLTLQKQRRVATEIANGRIESIRASPYTSLTPLTGSTAYLSPTSGTWIRASIDPGNMIAVGGIQYPIQTRVDLGAGGGSAQPTNSLLLTVTVTYRPSSGDHVTLTTVLAQLD